jgi:hypothetical protein
MDGLNAYTPFKMKAKDYGNSPMKKNYGQFGVGRSEMPEKPTPNKFTGMFGSVFGGNAIKTLMEKIKARKAEAAGAESPEGTEAEAAMEEAGGEGAVPKHGPESHTGGGGIGGLIKRGIGKPIFRGRRGNPFGGMFSDIRLKEKIEKTGISPSGIPIYEFNYIGSNNRYSGAMAQDLLGINPGAVMMDSSGYYKVNYNDIDVDMHQIN